MEPAADPFEHFWEQEQSQRIVEEHKAQLIRAAKELYAQNPMQPVVALIACAGSDEARHLVAQELSQVDPEQEHLIRFVTRNTLLQMVQHHAPSLRPYVREPDPEWKKTGRLLPVIIATAHGHRLVHLGYDAD